MTTYVSVFQEGSESVLREVVNGMIVEEVVLQGKDIQ